MTPGKYPITASQGSTYVLSFTISTDGTPWDLSDYSARMMVKSSPLSTTPILSASTDNGKIVLTSSGEVTVTFSATEMSAATPGRQVYDLELESAGGIVDRILEGVFSITPEVTA